LKIKSNLKHKNHVFDNLITNMKRYNVLYPILIRSLVIGVILMVSYFIWLYSGLLAIGFFIISTILTSPVDSGNKLGMSLLSILAILIFGLFDVYTVSENKIPIHFNKVVYTDSTEKIVLYATNPINEALVIQPESKLYYEFKLYDQNLSAYIKEESKRSHWANILDLEPTTFQYDLIINADKKQIKIASWKNTKTKISFGRINHEKNN